MKFVEYSRLALGEIYLSKHRIQTPGRVKCAVRDYKHPTAWSSVLDTEYPDSHS